MHSLVVVGVLSAVVVSVGSDTFMCPFDVDDVGRLTDVKKVVWCLPRNYSMERPPFGGGKAGYR